MGKYYNRKTGKMELTPKAAARQKRSKPTRRIMRPGDIPTAPDFGRPKRRPDQKPVYAQQPGFRSPPRTPTPRRRPKGGYWAGLNKPVKLPPTPRRRPKTNKKKPTKTGGGYRYKGKTYKKYGDIPTARKVAMRGKRKRPISSPKRKTATKKTERKLKRLITRETSRVSKRRPTRSEVNTFWRKRK